MTLTNKTGKSLLEFWDWSANKGLVNKNTALGLRSAVQKVLEIEDDWESINVAELDVEDLLHRFENLRATDYKPGSLATYKSRFRKAMGMYLDYLSSPSTWRPEIRRRSQTRNGESQEVARKAAGTLECTIGSRSATNTDRATFIEYPFPLRAGCVARFTLPPDLTAAEARRLSAFIASLAVEDEGRE